MVQNKGRNAMRQQDVIVAYIATLLAIVVLVVAGVVLGLSGRPVEALGIGGAVTGLIGVLGTFKHQNQVTVDNKESDAIPMKEIGDETVQDTQSRSKTRKRAPN